MVNLAQNIRTGCAVAASSELVRLGEYDATRTDCTSPNRFMQPTSNATATRRADYCTAPIRSVRYFNI